MKQHMLALCVVMGVAPAVVWGAQSRSDDNDLRQGHDFFYLTGIEIHDAVFVIDGLRKESVLFFTMDEAAAGSSLPSSSRKNWAARTAMRSSTRSSDR